MKKYRLVLIMIGLALVLCACTSGFKKGDVGIATEEITVVTDYNSPQNVKPTCTIHVGDKVTIGNYSTLLPGSSLEMPLIGLITHDCSGWKTDDSELDSMIEVEP